MTLRRFPFPGLGFQFLVSRFRFSGPVSDFRVQVSGFRFPGFGFRVSVSGFWVSVSGFRVWDVYPAEGPSKAHPTPYTLRFGCVPYTIHPELCTLHPTPLHPAPYTQSLGCLPCRGPVERAVEEPGVRVFFGLRDWAWVMTRRTFDHSLSLITYLYIAHCMGACSSKGEWSLFYLSLSLSPRIRV